jgi:hypothetical protein
MNDELHEEPVIGDGPPQANVLLSDKVYQQLKLIVQYVLPALAVFYITIAPLWGLPKQEEIAGTIMALDLLGGAILGISHGQWKRSEARYDGQVILYPEEDDGQNAIRFMMDDPSVLLDKDEVTVKVKRPRG